jgi:putative nucleotidyltransferase with HDIG domain
VNYARHGHAFTSEDWTALMDFFDLHLRDRKMERTFDQFPSEKELDAALARERAWNALRSRVKEEQYLHHSRALEAVMRAYAAATGGDAEEWGLAGLLHDIDLSATAKDLARHGVEGARTIRDLGFSEAVAHAVLSHDDRPGVPRASPLDHALYCADQVSWLLPSPLPDSAAPQALWERAQSLPGKREA